MTPILPAANLAAMAAILLLVFFALALMALAVRRAIPVAAACAAGWSAQYATDDPLTALIAGVSLMVLASAVLDRAALSERAVLRFGVRFVECLTGAMVATFLTWSFARAFGGGETTAQTAILCLCASILGGLIVGSRYRTAV